MNKTKLILAAALIASLWGCGGGGGGGEAGGGSNVNTGNNNTNDPDPAQTDPYAGGTYTGGNVPAAVVGATIVGLTIEDLSGTDQTSVPVTFGQVFAPGEITTNTLLAVRLADGAQTQLPSQVNKKATHADGSLRHAVISTRIPTLAANAQQDIEIVVVDNVPASQSVQLTDLLNTNFDGVVTLTVAGTDYTVSIADLLTNTQSRTWLAGSEVAEWMVFAPLKTATGDEHPHLTARFNIRAYNSFDSVRVDVVIENNWSYETAPQNLVYDASVSICGNNAYSATGFTHYHHARWRKTFWCGQEPKVHIVHDTNYIIESGAIPNFDQSLVIPENDLAKMDTDWTGTAIEPMGIGFAAAYMPATGARPGIGPLPRWTVRYLLSQDKRAKKVMLGTADLSGSWPMHYRDKTTNLPVSLDDFPYMTLLGSFNDTLNPTTGQNEAFPTCGGDCTTPYTHDVAHQPSLSYVPYLVTGDHYHLEELQFWANRNVFEGNPRLRGAEQGLLKWGQIRGQAWGLRTLGDSAYLTPDIDPLKQYFVDRVAFNLDWYNAEYTNNVDANQLGILPRITYRKDNLKRGVAPWQDDFFTWSVGHLHELGFTDALPLLEWKSTFAIGRMLDPDYCWIFASAYNAFVTDDINTSPVYTTFAEVYNATAPAGVLGMQCASQEMANFLGLSLGQMTGYANSATGYPANFQPALAVITNTNLQTADDAWDLFDNRPVKPNNYARYPNFAIIPRN